MYRHARHLIALLNHGMEFLMNFCKTILSGLLLSFAAASSNANAASTVDFLTYVHVQDYGQMTFAPDEWAGTRGEGRLEDGLALLERDLPLYVSPEPPLVFLAAKGPARKQAQNQAQRPFSRNYDDP